MVPRPLLLDDLGRGNLRPDALGLVESRRSTTRDSRPRNARWDQRHALPLHRIPRDLHHPPRPRRLLRRIRLWSHQHLSSIGITIG
jgi:hypothetical protein